MAVPDESGAERRLELRRRRSRVPWVFSVYHAPGPPPGGVRHAWSERSYPCRRRNAGTSSGDGSPVSASVASAGSAGSPLTTARACAGTEITERRRTGIDGVAEPVSAADAA